MTGSTPARRRAARDNGRLGGRPRLFANGMRRVSAAIPEDDARLIDLLAVRTGRSVSRVIADAVWTMLADEGFAPTWGIPDAARQAAQDMADAYPMTLDQAAVAVLSAGRVRSASGSGPLIEGDESGTRRPPGWGACQG